MYTANPGAVRRAFRQQLSSIALVISSFNSSLISAAGSNFCFRALSVPQLLGTGHFCCACRNMSLPLPNLRILFGLELTKFQYWILQPFQISQSCKVFPSVCNKSFSPCRTCSLLISQFFSLKWIKHKNESAFMLIYRFVPPKVLQCDPINISTEIQKTVPVCVMLFWKLYCYPESYSNWPTIPFSFNSIGILHSYRSWIS